LEKNQEQISKQNNEQLFLTAVEGGKACKIIVIKIYAMKINKLA